MLLSFIIPCYNEEESLPILYNRLNNVSKEIKDYEIYYLNIIVYIKLLQSLIFTKNSFGGYNFAKESL